MYFDFIVSTTSQPSQPQLSRSEYSVVQTWGKHIQEQERCQTPFKI